MSVTEISKTISQLDSRRREFGADSQQGWILSNAIEHLKSLQKAETKDQEAALRRFLQDTMKRLAEVLPPRRAQ